jgi:Fe-S-cluster containining protein
MIRQIVVSKQYHWGAMYGKVDQLEGIYGSFETEAGCFKTAAACAKGCAYCCTDAGRIHITTLEGLAIQQALQRLVKPQRMAVEKALAKDMRQRQRGLVSPCPFLMKSKACMIYQRRPFACRRIYSLETCGPQRPPILNRRVMELGADTIRTLQKLDDTGYSGHISFILYMLEVPSFRDTYLAGKFKPEEIADFGKVHHILINRLVSTNGDPHTL